MMPTGGKKRVCVGELSKRASPLSSLSPQNHKKKRTNQPVQRQRFRENEDENHADKQFGLLRVGADARVADDADRHAAHE